jgi:hypothetical protein
MIVHPSIKMGQLVGTDLVQAVPLVASASLGHVLFGDFTLGLTGSMVIGAIPGVWLAARVSSRTPGSLVRRVLTLVMSRRDEAPGCIRDGGHRHSGRRTRGSGGGLQSGHGTARRRHAAS